MRLITWNTCGSRWKALCDRIDGFKPDVVCIQEAGNLPKEFGGDANQLALDQVYELGTYSGLTVWYLPWDRSDGNGNKRCSMAMLFKDGGTPAISFSNVDKKRPIMRKSIGSNYYVCNIHAGGRDYVNEAIAGARTNGYGKTWIVAGDFNQGADEGLSWMDARGGKVIATDKPTRPASKRILDYAISSGDGKADLGVNYGGSDHLSVFMEFA